MAREQGYLIDSMVYWEFQKKTETQNSFSDKQCKGRQNIGVTDWFILYSGWLRLKVKLVLMNLISVESCLYIMLI